MKFAHVVKLQKMKLLPKRKIVAYASISVCLYLIAFKKIDPAASVIDLFRNFKDNAGDKTNNMDNPKPFRYEGDLNRPTSQNRVNETRNESVKIITQNKDGPKHSPILIDETPCEQRKFIVDRCLEHESCNGWADRQCGIVSTYLMAQLTKRYFVINHTKPCRLDRYLIPNRYNWTECSEYISSLPESHSQIVRNAKSRGFINAINKTDFDDVFQSQVVFIRTGNKWTDAIMSHPKAALNIPWAVGKSYSEIDKLVLDKLFRPVPKLEKDIRLYMEKLVGPQKLICGHIRVGQNPSIPKDVRRRAGGPNVTMILQFLKQYDVPSKYVVYVATDSEEIRQYVMEHFTSRFTVDMPIVHVDRFSYRNKSTACEGFYAAFLEQYLLSKCDLLVVTRSGFGAKAAYMSDKDQELYLYDLRSETIVKVTKDMIKPYYSHLPHKKGI